jgi:hypothetical protein
MAKRRRRSKVRALLAVGIGSAVLLSLVTVVAPLLVPWTRLNCAVESIDITTGRYRRERFLWWAKVRDQVHETELSRLYLEYGGLPSTPVWRRVNTLSPGVPNSPHYFYHHAFFAADQLVQAIHSSALDDNARKTALATFLKLLQSDEGDGPPAEYARHLWEENYGLKPG